MNALMWLYWNPSRDAFMIPWLGRPAAWYGILFAFGFFLAYLVNCRLFTLLIQSLPENPLRKKMTPSQWGRFLTDNLTWYAVIGTIVGARLGHVLFYEGSYYWTHPLAILRVWEGGLASHGAAVGLLSAIWLFHIRQIRRYIPECPFLAFFDLFSVCVPLAGGCIRLGNFVNQEILGTPSTLPWAVIFGNPLGGEEIVPRHPVQLYEALVYFLSFALLWTLWKAKHTTWPPGRIAGIMVFLIFGSRVILEFFKTSQSGIFDDAQIQTGQLLSLPFILLGLYLIFRRKSPA